MRFVRTPDGGVEITVYPADKGAMHLTKDEWAELVWRLANEAPPNQVIEGKVLRRSAQRLRAP